MENDGKTRILRIFFKEPFKEYYLREISLICKIPVDNAHKYLHEFVKKSFLRMRKTKNKTFFNANLKNDFLLKKFEYFELEKREDFFRQNPSLSKLRDITSDVLTLVWEPAMVLYNTLSSDILLVTSHASEKLSRAGVIKTISLKTFRNMKREELKNMLVLYNEFLFWMEIGKNA